MGRGPKINPVTGEFEFVPDQYWDLVFNQVEGEFEFAPPNHQPRFNTVSPSSGFKMREELADSVYNPVTGEWDVGTEDYRPVYNPVTGKWEMKP